MDTNFTLRQTSFFVTLIIVAINVFLICVSYYVFGEELKPKQIAFWIISAAIVGYATIRFLLEKYLIRKIRLIYKIIKKTKLNPNHENQDKVNHSLSFDDVGQQVNDWAIDTREEIKSLKALEDYRKNYVGTISHELKTPLFSIEGFLHTLVEGGLYDDRINMDYLHRSINNLERLKNIVNDLELINKLDSDEHTLDIVRFDMKKLALEVFADMEIHAKESNIELRFKDLSLPEYFVMADRENIRQVFSNLIVNAIKYGKEGGVINIAFYRMDNLILTEVSDNGIGIEKKHLNHLFDRFYRIDASRSREQGGSGLGLSIVKHIIEAHNHTINVRSTIGVGSTFGFTLSKA